MKDLVEMGSPTQLRSVRSLSPLPTLVSTARYSSNTGSASEARAAIRSIADSRPVLLRIVCGHKILVQKRLLPPADRENQPLGSRTGRTATQQLQIQVINYFC